MKLVLAIAAGIEVTKILFLLAFIPLTLELGVFENEIVSGLLFIPLGLLMLPEMMSSYEHGPHSIGAYIVMFTVGTLVNVVPAWTITKRLKGSREAIAIS